MRDIDIWPLALAYLSESEEITRASFTTWLATCKGHVAENRLLILTPSAFAKDWITGRYAETIHKAVSLIAGRDLTVTYDIQTDDQRQDCGAIIRLVSFDPTAKGFTQISNYAIRFWQPYIGSAPFALWFTLRSFAYDASNTKCWPSIHTLAGICFRGSRAQVRGRWRKHPKTGEAYWSKGALQILEQHKIVWWNRRQVTFGEHTYLQYIFSILDNPPLLIPEQIATLPTNIQRQHDDWLKDANLDREQWKQLDFEHLAWRTRL